ncbi:MAG TPA: TetR/AcrR family transcriptional regulator C-terminal ligand-binding domain-containing protein [Bryobacteraceae bacterium]|nr:TetR/AcrR family transcriptional regulator C-terminal ligand-binding domain-containing protein [Bryobacteraceae bacterium]
MKTATTKKRVDAARSWGVRRQARTRDRVLAAAARILRRRGYSELTMEGVATESGAAKTTLYRQWPTKAALCMDLYLDIAGRELKIPDTGSVAGDLRHIFHTVVHLQTRTVAGPAFLGLLTEAQVNPETRQAFLAEFAERRREVTRAVLRRAMERGEIRRGTNIDVFIDALGGACTFRLLQGHAPLTNGFANALIRLLLEGCSVRRQG